MSKYSTNRKPSKKLVTINLDLEVTEEDQVRSLIKDGEKLLKTLESIKQDKLDRTTSEIEKVKKSIEDLKA